MSIAVSGPSAAAVVDTAAGGGTKAQPQTGSWDDTYAAAHAAAQANPSQEDTATPTATPRQVAGKASGQQVARAPQGTVSPQRSPVGPTTSLPNPVLPGSPPPLSAAGNSADNKPLAPPIYAADNQAAAPAAPPDEASGSASSATLSPYPGTAETAKPGTSSPQDARRLAAKVTTRDPATAADLRPVVTEQTPPPSGHAQADKSGIEEGGNAASPPAGGATPRLPQTLPQDKKSWHLVTGQHAAPSSLASNLAQASAHLVPSQTNAGTGQAGVSVPANPGSGHGSLAAVVPSLSNGMSALPLSHVAAAHASPDAPDPQTPNPPAQPLLQQATLGLALDKGGTAHVTLHPPTLGRVTVQVTMAPSGTAHIQITAATPDGYAALATSNAALMQHLAHKGVAVGSMQMQMQGDAGQRGTSSGGERDRGSQQPVPSVRWTPQTSDEAVIAYA